MTTSKTDRIYKGNSIKTIPECFPENYFVIDIETTGTNIYADDIIEIGALKIVNNNIVDKFQSLVAFQSHTKNEAYHINHILPDMLTNAPSLKNVLKDFFDFIGQGILIFHAKSHFDINIIYDKAAEYGLSLNNNFIDLLNLSSTILPKINGYSAENLAEYFGIDYSNAHRALADCQIEFEIYGNLKNLFLNNDIDFKNILQKDNNVSSKSISGNTSDDFIKHTELIGFNNPFFEKKCVITGSFTHFKDNYRDIILDNLGVNTKGRGNVSGSTNFLITGSNPGYSKIEKANNFGTTIINEKEFYSMLGYNSHYKDDKPEIAGINPNEIEALKETQPEFTKASTLQADFLTMYVEVDENIFTGKIKVYDSIKAISISEYKDNEPINTYCWEVSPSSKLKDNAKYLHEVWEEIQPIIFNKTVIIFDANFAIRTIIETFKYLINKSIPNTEPVERCFPELLKKLKAIRFDFMCLSLIIRRLFKDSPSNKLFEICKVANIDYGITAEEHSMALGSLLYYVITKTKASSLLELKHLSGITLGQVTKNISKKESTVHPNKIIEYDKYYYPCVAITDEEIFRKYSF